MVNTAAAFSSLSTLTAHITNEWRLKTREQRSLDAQLKWTDTCTAMDTHSLTHTRANRGDFRLQVWVTLWLNSGSHPLTIDNDTHPSSPPLPLCSPLPPSHSSTSNPASVIIESCNLSHLFAHCNLLLPFSTLFFLCLLSTYYVCMRVQKKKNTIVAETIALSTSAFVRVEEVNKSWCLRRNILWAVQQHRHRLMWKYTKRHFKANSISVIIPHQQKWFISICFLILHKRVTHVQLVQVQKSRG